MRFRPALVVLSAGSVAAACSAFRQRQEALTVRRGLLPPASASADVPQRATYGPIATRVSHWIPTPPTTPVGRLSARIWAGPLTAIGYLIGLMAGSRPTWDEPWGCFVARGARGPSGFILRRLGADANTIGQVVIATETRPSLVLLAHESTHVRQAERLGPFQFPLYVWFGARYGYRDNPFERAARSGARRWSAEHRPQQEQPEEQHEDGQIESDATDAKGR